MGTLYITLLALYVNTVSFWYFSDFQNNNLDGYIFLLILKAKNVKVPKEIDFSFNYNSNYIPYNR
jgi:Co/Zn/Cd efflux system component